MKMKTRWELANGVDRRWVETLLQDDDGKVVKQSPAKLVTCHHTDRGVFYIKRSRHKTFLFRPFKYWFKDSPGRWEWGVAQAMQALGIPVVRHLALCEIWSTRGLLEDIVVTQGFDGKPLHEAGDVDSVQVMDFVEQCHQKGMVHGDLHPANILVHLPSGELRLADLKGVRIEKKPDSGKQLMDLAYLNIHFPMPLPEKLLELSDRVRRKKMAIRCGRCLKNNREFEPQSHGDSRWQVRKPMMNDELAQVLAAPDSALTGESLLKAGHSSTVGQSARWVVKRYNFKKPLNLIKDLFRVSKAKRAFQLGYHLELVGVATPRVIAVMEDRPLGIALRSYLVMEKIAGATDLAAVDRDGGHLAKRLVKLIGRMHAEGFTHRDLKASNVLVDPEGKPWLIDLDGLSYTGRVSIRVAVSNLKRLERGLRGKPIFTVSNRMLFLRHYCRATGFRPSELKAVRY